MRDVKGVGCARSRDRDQKPWPALDTHHVPEQGQSPRGRVLRPGTGRCLPVRLLRSVTCMTRGTSSREENPEV